MVGDRESRRTKVHKLIPAFGLCILLVSSIQETQAQSGDGSSQVPSWGDGPPLGPAVLTLLSRSAAFVLQEPTINLPVISYKLTCTPREEFFYANNATALSSSIRVFVEGLHPGVRYECTYRARNSAGNSVPSQTTSIKIADALSDKPASINVTLISPTSITVHFEAPPVEDSYGNIIAYSISYHTVQCLGALRKCPCRNYHCSLGGSTRPTADAVGKPFVLDGLRYYTTYLVSVAAINGAGEGIHAEANITTGTTSPGSVSELTAKTLSESTIRITWQPPEEPNGMILYYRVEYTKIPNSENSTFSFNISAPATTANITDLLPKTLLLVTVSPVNAQGEGPAAATHGLSVLPVVPVTQKARLKPDTPKSKTPGFVCGDLKGKFINCIDPDKNTGDGTEVARRNSLALLISMPILSVAFLIGTAYLVYKNHKKMRNGFYSILVRFQDTDQTRRRNHRMSTDSSTVAGGTVSFLGFRRRSSIPSIKRSSSSESSLSMEMVVPPVPGKKRRGSWKRGSLPSSSTLESIQEEITVGEEVNDDCFEIASEGESSSAVVKITKMSNL
eukprot:scpid66981/ scgid23433/ Protein sidekick-1